MKTQIHFCQVTVVAKMSICFLFFNIEVNNESFLTMKDSDVYINLQREIWKLPFIPHLHPFQESRCFLPVLFL